MTPTRFPNGLSGLGGDVTHNGVTWVTGSGTITTTLDTITSVQVSLGTALGTATNQVFTAAGTAHVNASGAATFIARVYQVSGSAGTVVAPVVWTARGTKA